MMKQLHVAVGIVFNNNEQVCISYRNKTQHLGNLWEFPGGKIEVGETKQQALKRELKEELGVTVQSARPLISVQYDDHDVRIHLYVYKIKDYQNKVSGVEGQKICWVSKKQLQTYQFPQVNSVIIKAINLPSKYAITGDFLNEDDFIKKLKNLFTQSIKLIQVRLKNTTLSILQQQKLLEKTALLCQQENVELMLNLESTIKQQIDFSTINFAGFHVDSIGLAQLKQRPQGQLFSASCHNRAQLKQAQKLNADFVVLSPVQQTATHPEATALGWLKFSNMIEQLNMPVFALGGMQKNQLETAYKHGAQGIAGIRVWWH